MVSKYDLRLIIKRKMENLDPSKKCIMDEKIRNNIYSLRKYFISQNIFSYVSKEKEVDTINLIDHSITIGKMVCVPLVNKEDNSLEARRINSLLDLKVGNFNILEPNENTEITNLGKIEILFIPGLAFSTECERLGRGGGYFDRFLSEATGVKIGLAYDFQIFQSLPVEKHDIKMDIIITDERIINHV